MAADGRRRRGAAPLSGAAGAILVALAALLAAISLAACELEEDEDAPPTTPEGATELPRIGPGPALFGYTDSPNLSAETLDLLADSGAELLKVPLGWIRVEREPGERDWEVYDRLYVGLLERGIRPAWSLNSAPCWATDVAGCEKPPHTSYPPAPDRIDEFAEFAGEVVERYPETLGIEVWNEPNLADFWRGGADPERYRRLLAATAAEIERADPEMPVASGGLSPLEHRRSGSVPWSKFIGRAFDPASFRDVDAASFHPYPRSGPGSDYLGEIAKLLDRFAATLRTAGVGRPIWVTETGISTAGPAGVPPAAQAQGLARIHDVLTRRTGVQLVAFHRFVDAPDPNLPREAGYGVVALGGSNPKLAYCAVAAAAGTPCEESGEPGP